MTGFALFDTPSGIVAFGVFAFAAIALGYLVPGWLGMTLAAVLLAAPYLAIALFAAIAGGFVSGVTGSETGWARGTLGNAAVAALVGAVLAGLGGILRKSAGQGE